MTLPPVEMSGGEVDLRQLTPARVALGRTGPSLPTAALLSFGLDHARARDAVHAVFDAEKLANAFKASGEAVLCVRSQVADRAEYLKRPDLGRALDTASRDLLSQSVTPADCVIVIGDGLSPGAVMTQAPALVIALKAKLSDLKLAPIVIASGARVALGDEIAILLNARLVIVLIGERPGLSTPESLGAYLTFGPRPGLTDAGRNCVSNIHGAGLSVEAAAARIAWLAQAALSRGLSGVALKDESSLAALPVTSP